MHSRPSIWCIVLLVRHVMAKKGRLYDIANTRSHSRSLSPALRSETYHLSVGRSSRSVREKVLETYRKDTRSTSHLQNHLSAPSEVSVPASTRAAQLRPADERPAPMLPPWWRDWWRDGIHAVVTRTQVHIAWQTLVWGRPEEAKSNHDRSTRSRGHAFNTALVAPR